MADLAQSTIGLETNPEDEEPCRVRCDTHSKLQFYTCSRLTVVLWESNWFLKLPVCRCQAGKDSHTLLDLIVDGNLTHR